MKQKKRGCCGSTELAIVVARRSWREISLWKTQHMKNSLNFVNTCLKVVDTRRIGKEHHKKLFRGFYWHGFPPCANVYKIRLQLGDSTLERIGSASWQK